MIIDGTIMGGNEQWDLEDKIIEICKIDHKAYMKSRRTLLTRELFERYFKQILKLIEEYTDFKFHIAYQVLGRFVLLLGVQIDEEIRQLIISAANWSWEEGAWDDKDFEDERKFRFNDLRKRITNYISGSPNPLEEDLFFLPDLVRFHKKQAKK